MRDLSASAPGSERLSSAHSLRARTRAATSSASLAVYSSPRTILAHSRSLTNASVSSPLVSLVGLCGRRREVDAARDPAARAEDVDAIARLVDALGAVVGQRTVRQRDDVEIARRGAVVVVSRRQHRS